MGKKITVCDGSLFHAFLRGGCANLDAHKEEINALNIFPVPDGDTGINMSLTLQTALEKLPPDGSSGVGALASVFAKGTLMGARGNSGVILSQIFRGFAVALDDLPTARADDFAAALQKGVDLSYKSVIKPVEGTILTVYRAFAAAAVAAAVEEDDLVAVLQTAQQAGEAALAQTPEQLPVLKEAGVVDAGGQGLMVFFAGALAALTEETPAVPLAAAAAPAATVPAAPAFATVEQDIVYTYCTQMLIQGDNLPVDEIRAHLSQTPPGDSLLVVGDEHVVKIHFHNNHPGQVLEYCAGFGTLHEIIIDNMRDQHHATQWGLENAPAAAPAAPVAAPAAPPEVALPESPADDAANDALTCGVLAVCAGEAMTGLYEELGATVIPGGQTMNPSAQDILAAVEACPAREVVILPNNGNIIMAASQVRDLTEKPVAVVPTKYVTQGISALMGFLPERTAAENAAVMEERGALVVNGELTFAIRDTRFNGFKIHEGDILGLLQGEIVCCGKKLDKVLLQLMEKMVAAVEEPELISLFYGNDLELPQAEKLGAKIASAFPDLDVELREGGQPLYYFLLAVE